MKNDRYKYFQKGDKIVSVKKRINFRFYGEILGDKPKLFKIYTFNGYVPLHFKTGESCPDYNLLRVKEDELFYDGHEFISIIEYRRLKLKRIKRKLFFKKLFGK